MLSLDNFELNWITVFWGVMAFLVSFTLSAAAFILVLVKLPATFFQSSNRSPLFRAVHPLLCWGALIGKNLVALLAIVLGMGLAIPGIPGPGLLIALVGVMLLDFPGKRRLVKKLIGRPRVLKALNAWRHRFGKPPFVLDTTPMGPKPPGICGGIPPPGLPSSASDPCGVAMSCADPRESERRP